MMVSAQVFVKTPRLVVGFQYPKIKFRIGVVPMRHGCRCPDQLGADAASLLVAHHVQVVEQGAKNRIVVQIKTGKPHQGIVCHGQ